MVNLQNRLDRLKELDEDEEGFESMSLETYANSIKFISDFYNNELIKNVGGEISIFRNYEGQILFEFDFAGWSLCLEILDYNFEIYGISVLSENSKYEIEPFSYNNLDDVFNFLNDLKEGKHSFDIK